jgi:hypothetical protein
MDDTKKNFWMGVGIGGTVIIILDLLVPFLGPLLGGFIAGVIAKGGIMNAGKAGFVAGILATLVISLVILAGMMVPPIGEYLTLVSAGYILFIVLTFYLALFAFIGGVIAGAIRK